MTAAAAVTVFAAAAGPARAAGGGDGGSCGAAGYPWGYNISCQQTASAAGAPAETTAPPRGVPAAPYTPCALYPIAGSTAQMLKVCPDGISDTTGRYAVRLLKTANTVVPVGAAAAAVTPQQLLAWAQNELPLPLPAAATAPPRGRDALAGLPEWYWVPAAQWHPQTVRVQAGGVWAAVTATPAAITIQPGPAGAAVTCPGPGAAYNPALPAGAQHSDCTYTYSQSSDGQPGSVYQASVTVTWSATWQGTGGAGGALPPLDRTTTFAVPVAEAQALTPGTGS